MASVSARTGWSEINRWLYGPGVVWIFSTFFVLGAVLLLASLTWCKALLSTTDKVALSAALLTAAIIWWQGQLVNRQLAYGTVLDLYKEWNSEGMLKMRRNAWNPEKEVPNSENVEGVLEFLEKVSTLERDRYITRELVWDTFGWYVGRYFFYCKEEIERLRTKWTHRYDPTLYQDLEKFYCRLLALEAKQRNLKRHEIEEEYNQTRKKFILSEVE
jgi:hypothetical protein